MITITRRPAFLSAAFFIPALFLFTSCQKGIDDTEDPEATQEFFTFTVDGVSHTWHTSPYHLYAKEDTSEHGVGLYYNLLGAYDTVVGSHSIDLVLPRPSNSPAEPPLNFDIESISVFDQTAPASFQGDFYPQLVSQATITEFGPIGGYISGSFSGIYEKSTILVPVDTVIVSCKWRIKREAF